MRKLVAVKFMMIFDPIDTRWTTMSDVEHWWAKHLAESNLEGTRLEVIGNTGELVVTIKSKPEVVATQKSTPKLSNLGSQFKNLKVK